PDNTAGEVILLDLGTGRTRRLVRKLFLVMAIRFSPDGKTLAARFLNSTEIRSWDIASGQEKHPVIRVHPHVVDTFAFAPNGKVLASGSRDGAVRFWDVATGKKQKTLKRDGERVLAVEFSPDGRTLATATERAPRLSKVRLW